MKKILSLLSVLFLLFLNSCSYNGYSGGYSDLYTVAVNSVLWLNGYSWGADFECDPQIEKIDEDSTAEQCLLITKNITAVLTRRFPR